jgi:asparagine synthase (glutamine-hydrolysing)
MLGFAGWVALGGPAPGVDQLKPWQDWLGRHGRHAKTVPVEHGWLLQWMAAPAGEGDAAQPEPEAAILVGDWCCEAGPEPQACRRVVSALVPANGQPITYPNVANGFALCHWQPQGRVLTLASDHLGCRPLYVARQGDQVLFSTDLPMLLDAPGLNRRLNLRSMVNLLVAADAGRPGDTLYEDVQRIAPGSLWQWGPNRTVCRPLPDGPVSDRARRTCEPKESAQSLRECVISAVHDGLAGAHRPAIHLSGGLDSAALACIAARALRQQGRSLLALCSVLPDGASSPSGEADEREYIAHVLAQEPNIQPVWVTMPADEHPFAALPQWFSTVGQVSYNTATHALARLGLAGRAHGVDVVLNGFGGDLFASAPTLGTTTALLQQHRWGAALAQLLCAIRQRGPRALGAEFQPLIRRLVRARADMARPALITEAAWRAFEAETQPHQRAGAAVRRMECLNAQQQMAAILRPGQLDLPVSEMCQFMSRSYGQTLCLPLLDPRVLAQVLEADPREFTRDGLSRSLFRRAMVGLLPEANRLRTDKGPAFDPALMSHIVANRSELQAWAQDSTRPAWQILDRQTFLAALDQVKPAARAQWRRETFGHVILGGVMGRFLDWQAGVTP